MKPKLIFLTVLLLALAVAMPAAISSARPLNTASSYGGTFTNWPSTWTAVSGLNDPDDGLSNERLDFVGDSSDPGAYYYGNPDYLFFRVRVDDGAATEFADTVMIVIDRDRDGTPDYAFMWDSKEAQQENHGLEMGILNTNGPTWAGTRMDDRDGNNAKKIAPPDFGLTNGDGYIRLVNNQSTAHFGTTTFIDFAIKWDYLIANTALRKGETWNIQLGSIDQANDHNWINYDVAGGKSPSDSRTFPGTVSFSPTAVTTVGFRGRNHVQDYGVVLALIILSLCLGWSLGRSRPRKA